MSLRILLFLAFTVISFSCKKENAEPEPAPIADFSYTGAGIAPSTLKFTNSTTNASSYSWDFGDNSSSTEQNPDHIYSTGGTYTIKLTAKGGGGTSSISKTINISKPPAPVASFTFNTSSTTPSTVTFANTTTDASSYSWNFGDANSPTNTSTIKSPQHIYNNGGTYTVSLTVTGTGGSHTTSASVTILNTPTANFTFTGQGTAPSTVAFSNTSTYATTYIWDFGDILSVSNNFSTQVSPKHIFSKGDVYNVTLTAIGAGGSITTTKSVTITNPTKAKITAIKITDMSFLDPSCNCTWDPNTGPDVIYRLEDKSLAVLANGSALSNASATSLPISWPLPAPVEINDFNSVYKIYVSDQDTNDFPSNSDDLIGGYAFTLATSAALGFQEKITLQSSSNKLKIELTVQWQ